ncbi:serine hydrolase domain-containing protein [Halalkalibaculum sp. DA3122]|uniref:serine hydrolase domain-containing protein n=1 Tax=Halalkalibaculum sp. DA3122 TaxID=3373607 RepID=UPI003754ACB1
MKKLCILFLLFIYSTSGPSFGQPVPVDSVDLHAFLDGTIQSYMEEQQIAGATLAVIQNGQPLMLKGYGYADRRNQVPVDPNQTLFRVGSISKLFVWTAVMQLVEEGQLDLNTDVNRYLEAFTIPDTYPEPITLKHLMTHTAGFEDRIIGLFALDTGRLRPLEEILIEELPARVHPPGQIASYSNHGTAIATHIVEQVSGLRFPDYIEQLVLHPLEMDATTFRQPVPEPLQPRLSRGYAVEEGILTEQPFEFVPLGPVGTASSTAADMIPFIQAHLNLGSYQGNTLLDSTTARLMQSQAFSHHDQLNPMRYGFIDMSQNGVSIFGHRGSTFWFHSLLALFPDYDIGFFISFNSAGGAQATQHVLEAFVDRYFPDQASPPDTMSTDQPYLQQFAGEYRSNRYSHERLTKIISLMNPVTVQVTGDRTLNVTRDGQTQEWIPTESLQFRNTENRHPLIFRQNSDGEITHLFFNDMPFIAFEKIPFISSRTLHFTLLGITFATLLLTLLYWPAAYLVRRPYRPTLITTSPLPLYIKIIAWLNSLLLLVFYIGLGTSLTGPESIVYGLSSAITFWLIFPLISVMLTITLWYLTFRAWENSLSGFWSRLCLAIISIVFTANLWQLYHWNWLGFHY